MRVKFPVGLKNSVLRQIVLLMTMSILLACCLFGQNKDETSSKQWKERTIINAKELTGMDRVMLEIAQHAANECAHALEKAISSGAKTEKELFCQLYFPRQPLTSPRTFTTFYDDYTDSVITPIEDYYLAKNENLFYVTLVDKNGYVPSHNSKYSKPYSGDVHIDYQYSRTKRIFNDIAGYSSGHNQDPFLLQIYYRDTGEKLADLSVPVWVKNRHWGSLRVGYLRGE